MVKTNLPVLVLKDIILFPHSEIRLELEEDKDKELISLALSYYNKHILIVSKQDLLEETANIADLPKIGVIGYIGMKIDLPNKKTRIVIQGINRVKVDQYEEDEDKFINSVVEQIEYDTLDQIEEIAYSRSLIKQFEYYIDHNSNMSNSILSTISGITDIDKLTDILCLAIPGSYARKLEYLYECNPTIRVKMLLDDLSQELKIINLEQSLESEVNRSLDQAQKEYILNEKLKVIKKELGDNFDKDLEINDLKEKIKDFDCPKNIKERLNLELKRYESTPISSPEVAVIRNYIDWILSLPWQVSTKDNKDLNLALEKLDSTHYGLEKVKQRIIEYLAVEQVTKNSNTPIICLVGPPGVGKTSLAKSIASSINRKYTKISVGGINDEAEIVGHRRAYIGSSPGRIIQGIKKAGSNNPVFVIDEIDKMCKDIKGDPSSSLLEVLDKEQNKYFSDNYIEEEFDLSKVMFIATANYESNIPLELYDRLEVIEISSYTEIEKLNIAKRHIIPKELKDHGLKDIIFSDKAIYKIIRNYTKEAGVRELERVISTILRKIVTNKLTTKENEVSNIKESDIVKYLGKEKYLDHTNDKKDNIGIVNGLSYTIFGGDILPIEVNYYKGAGQIITTGSLGDIFIESMRIALSYIKSNYKKFGINYDLLTKSDIHIHVPEGAVRKDGPSAGCAITTSIISALTGKRISSDISMTGEITLRGNVLPIGGLKEKLIGAKRANVKKVFIPKENERDLEEIDKIIIKSLEIKLVSNYEEIAKELNLYGNE